jgi:peptidoglycan/LPS O-acetylase OafA/YrhL
MLLLLGESSYALYILHAPIKGWFVLVEKHIDLSRWISLPVQGLLYFTFTLTLSIVAYKKIEVPWRRRIQGFSWNRRTFVLVSPDTRELNRSSKQGVAIHLSE